MPTRNAVLLVAAVSLLGVTGCEKQSPYVTVTAHGVTVKARAVRYCRGAGDCHNSDDSATIRVRPGDTLGIDVPRSLADDGWRVLPNEPFRHDHYRALPISRDLQGAGSQPINIQRDPAKGEGLWRFVLVSK